MSTETQTLRSIQIGLMTGKGEEKKETPLPQAAGYNPITADADNRFAGTSVDHSDAHSTSESGDVEKFVQVKKSASQAQSFQAQKKVVAARDKAVEAAKKFLEKIGDASETFGEVKKGSKSPAEQVQDLLSHFHELIVEGKEKKSKDKTNEKELLRHFSEIEESQKAVDEAFGSEPTNPFAETTSHGGEAGPTAEGVKQLAEIQALLEPLADPTKGSQTPQTPEQVVSFIDAKLAELDDKKNQLFLTGKNGKPLTKEDLKDPKVITQVKELTGQRATLLKALDKARALIGTQLGAGFEQHEEVEVRRESRRREESRKARGAGESGDKNQPQAATQSVRSTEDSQDSTTGGGSHDEHQALAGINSVPAGQTSASEGGEPTAPASLASEPSTFVHSQSVPSAGSPTVQFLRTMTDQSLFLQTQSTSNQLQSDLHKADDLLKKLIRAIQNGGSSDLLSIAWILNTRQTQLMANRGMVSLLNAQNYGEQQLDQLTGQIANIQGGDAQSTGQMAAINTQMQRYLGDRQTLQSMARTLLDTVQQSTESTSSIVTIEERIGLRTSNFLGQGG